MFSGKVYDYVRYGLTSGGVCIRLNLLNESIQDRYCYKPRKPINIPLPIGDQTSALVKPFARHLHDYIR